MLDKDIPEPWLRRQAWKCYLVLIAWPTYLFFVPFVYDRWGAAFALFLIFPGVYLFTWISLLTHELWHKSIPGVPHTLFYYLFSWMLLADPQIYAVLHSFHHTHVNSWDDLEFHPFGEIKSKGLRILTNVMEIVLGMIYVVIAYTIAVPRHPQCGKQYRYWKWMMSLFIRAGYLGSIGYLAHRVFGVPGWRIFVAYTLTYWVGAVFVRHSQLVEHGNLIVSGDWTTRNLRSRNLKDTGLFEKVFLLLTHGDSREHVLHHTLPHVYSRPFPGQVDMPHGAAYITLRDYGRILGSMMMGRESPF